MVITRKDVDFFFFFFIQNTDFEFATEVSQVQAYITGAYQLDTGQVGVELSAGQYSNFNS